MFSRLTIIFLCLGIHLYAINPFYENRNQGWFSYEEPAPVDENKTKKQDSDKAFMASIPLNKLNTMSAEEFSKTIDKAKAIAIMNPSPENIFIVKTLVKFATDQSEKFSKNYILANFDNPEFTYPEIAKDKYSIDAADATKLQAQKQWFDSRPYLILVMFYNPASSELVSRQNNVYRLMKIKFPNLQTMTIDQTVNQKLVNALKITQPIENFIYDTRTSQYYRVSAWLSTEDELIRNIMFVVKNKTEMP